MTENEQLGCEEYEAMLLEAAKYSGNQEKEKRIFSASSLGNEPLQNFLKFKHGGKSSTQYEANTVGSIYQLGVDMAADADKQKYTSAKRLTLDMGNGWTLSGEMDQIDEIRKIIFDNKVTTATTIGKIRSQGKSHQYALQMGSYKLLIEKDEEARGLVPSVYSAILPVVDKSFSYFKANNKFNQLTFVDVETYTTNEIFTMVIEATTELDKYIELDEMPPKCKEVWPYGAKGKATKPMRCIYYCDFAQHCPYFSTEGPAPIKALLNL